jgi:phosphatidylinositol-3-phosphatase
MRTDRMALAVLSLVLAETGYAQEGPVPRGIPRLDHVFVIMEENHGYGQMLGNPNAPFINEYMRAANLATNYFAVAHPSLTNHLEIVGGSNFGVLSDNDPDWHNASCQTNLATGLVSTDRPASPPICPIAGVGTEAAMPIIDFTNQSAGPPGTVNFDGVRSMPAATHIVGKTIADQLVATGRSWKSYEDGMPATGPDRINYADGLFSNLTDFSTLTPPQRPPLSSSLIVALYAPKHNPFVYFRNVQEGGDPRNSLKNSVGFAGLHGLYADLRVGQLPNFALIVPTQCDDQHGRENAGRLCALDPTDDGSQEGLNPALIQRSDIALRNLIDAINGSPAWRKGRNAIVVVWDENDYSNAPNVNQVVLTVDTNYGPHGLRSGARYTHFSLLRSLESGFGLPCLNHACDADEHVMADLFADTLRQGGGAPTAADTQPPK